MRSLGNGWLWIVLYRAHSGFLFARARLSPRCPTLWTMGRLSSWTTWRAFAGTWLRRWTSLWPMAKQLMTCSCLLLRWTTTSSTLAIIWLPIMQRSRAQLSGPVNTRRSSRVLARRWMGSRQYPTCWLPLILPCLLGCPFIFAVGYMSWISILSRRKTKRTMSQSGLSTANLSIRRITKK